MAIQKEPGQKGVSWSNIAVGMWALSVTRRSLMFGTYKVRS